MLPVSQCIYVGTGSYNGIVSPISLSDMYRNCELNSIEENIYSNLTVSYSSSRNELFIHSGLNNIHHLNVRIYTLEGKEVNNAEVTLQSELTSVELPTLAGGVYLYIFSAKGKPVKSGKFVL